MYVTCPYFKFQARFVILLLNVEDILIMINCKPKVEKDNVELNDEFDMKHLGVAKKILVIEIVRWCDLKCLKIPTLGKSLDKDG